jgi:hypothetical protein
MLNANQIVLADIESAAPSPFRVKRTPYFSEPRRVSRR